MGFRVLVQFFTYLNNIRFRLLHCLTKRIINILLKLERQYNTLLSKKLAMVYGIMVTHFKIFIQFVRIQLLLTFSRVTKNGNKKRLNNVNLLKRYTVTCRLSTHFEHSLKELSRQCVLKKFWFLIYIH